MRWAILAVLMASACTPAEDPEIESAKRLVARNLRDPGSAQFRDVTKCAGKPGMVTGEVNAKNGFGAYGGFELFFVHSGSAWMLSAYPFDAANEKDVSYFKKLVDVCYEGGNPDFGAFYNLSGG
ncbi:hypothetical protein [Sphingobium agri]|uniref:Lipoprotein n=1 Tax=Sphingobium agri TaxID=2933566 RepID=A0ABT0E207_9SPHN|nr:hypothetical protein [Sphingobium agri]MCK0533401.1 hypothetical protein [Sphingobium agri]